MGLGACVAACAGAIAACVGDTTTPGPDAGTGNDSGPPTDSAPGRDSSPGTDAGADGAPNEDAGDGGGDASSATYNDITKGANWATFDIASIASNAVGFSGGAFDGQYVYFAPTCVGSCAQNSTTFVRYNTAASFSSSSSYELFNANTQGFLTAGNGYLGAVFAGQYVYFISHTNVSGATGTITRYDTKGSFTAKGSWIYSDVSNVAGGLAGFSGGVFDGSKYLYLIPNASSALDGVFGRYDTTAAFSAGPSWTPYDVAANVLSTAVGFSGGVFDGQYLYAAPQSNGVATRYDTTATFTAGGSWATFDMVANVNANASNYNTAGFDGKYVYFVPSNSGNHGLVVRYDSSSGKFATSGAWWSSYDTTNVNPGAKGFFGSAFDGRFMYFVPGLGGSIVTRYDTTASFTTPGAWSVYDTTSTDSKAKGFNGAAFDGRYVYFIPNNNGAASGVIARFDAKAPPSMPKGYSGSFY